MLNYLLKFADRILFTVVYISALQLPAFMQEYRQRLAGHLSEAKRGLADYEVIAAKNFDGDMKALIAEYQGSESESFQQTGAIIANNLHRVEELEWVFSHLSHPQLWKNLYYFLFNFDREIVEGTFALYQPTIPLTFDAWILALLCGISISLSATGLWHLAKLLYSRIKLKMASV